MQNPLKQNLYWTVPKLWSTWWLGFEALLGNKRANKVDWTNCLNWISIAKLVVHCANECIFNIWINFPYSIKLLLLYSLSSPHVVHLHSIVLQISIWSENKIANTSLVNEVQWLQVVWVCKHCKFYQCEKKLQADFVSVDTTMSSMNVEVVKHLQAVHGRSYNHMGKISP